MPAFIPESKRSKQQINLMQIFSGDEVKWKC